MTTPAEIRGRAACIVADLNSAGKSLDALLANLQGTAQERGLLRSLVYGTTRWQIRLEAILKALSSRPQNELEPQVRALLLVGLFQLLHTDIAPHAAVAETVEATRALKLARAAGLVNAVLRRCQREAPLLTERLDTNLALRTAHPQWLVDKLRQDWPERYVEILEANNAHPPMWLRVNTRHISLHEYLQQLRAAGLHAEPNERAPEALVLTNPVDVRTLPGFTAGDVSVQDAAAQLAAHLLAPRSGDRVLDACSAPGGKACHLLELQSRIAELVALDVSTERLRRVRENLDRLKLAATLVEGDAIDPKTWWDGRPFQRILLDVPCSATGVIRRHPDIKLLRRSTDIEDLVRRQTEILQCTWPLLEQGGRLVYASCSALRAETSDVVSAFQADRTDARDVTDEACAKLGIFPSRGTIGLTIHTGQAQMDGFYYACLEKRK